MSSQIEENTETKSNLRDLIELLFVDVQIAREELTNKDSQYNRRSFVRAVFAMIEGVSYIFKQECLNSSSFNRVRFSDAEIALLREESYVLNSRSQAVTKPQFLPTADNYRFAMNMYMKRADDESFKLDVSGHEWDIFVGSFKIRHRIIHPKNPLDFNISDDEIEQINQIYLWFIKTTIKVLLDVNDELKDQINKYKVHDDGKS